MRISRAVRRLGVPSVLVPCVLLSGLYSLGRVSAEASTAGRATARAATQPVPNAIAASIALNSKKGVGAAKYLSRDRSKLEALKVSWAYNWSPWVPATSTTLETVPMIWNASAATPTAIRSLTHGRTSGQYKSLLGFNEPDNKNQANMTPEQAIAAWPRLQSTGLRLGSPAPAVATDGWLDKFMRLANQHSYRVDFITLHFYLDFTNPKAASALGSTLAMIYNRYKKPIWITELGAVDIRPWGLRMAKTPTSAAAVTFMSQVTTILDQLTFVQRYAWFTDNCWTTPQLRTSSLYDGTGRLTALGKSYSKVR